VSVAALPASPTTPVDETLLGECRVVGTGERAHWGGDHEYVRFDVFPSRESRDAALVIAQPEAVAVTWSHFPSPSDHKRRAEVGLGGQKHVRFDGWSTLAGRTFTAEKRLFAEPGHLWARTGSPIEMLGAEGRVAVARVATPFASPTSLVVRGGCDGVAYSPEEPERTTPERKALTTATTRTHTLALFTAPSGQAFTTLAFEEDFTLGLDVMARKDGFVRVVGEAEDIGLDAWVRAGDIEEDAIGGLGLHGFGTSGCGGVTMSVEHGVVKRDTALFVGKTPIPIAGAVVEKDAEIRFQRGDETTVGGRTYVAFDFEDFEITAPDEQRMWIAKDLIDPK
jgi:hypothetical protein